MPDFDNDNPDFDGLIAQARQLREEGNHYKAISLAVRISLEVLANYHDFSGINEAVNICKQVLDTLNQIRPDEVVDSPGIAYAVLAGCASVFSENDPYHLSQISRSKAGEYGWTDFHTKCHFDYINAPDENLDEALKTFLEMAQENPAAWFYVGEFEGLNLKGGYWHDAREAFLQVPEDDPNYVRAMLRAGEYWEFDAEGEKGEVACGFMYEAEDCYEKAIEKAPKSQEVRRRYLRNHLELLLKEAAENGFERDRVEQASEFVEKMIRVLSGESAEIESGARISGTDEQNLPLPHPELYDRYIAEHNQLLRRDIFESRQLLQDLLRQISSLTAETQQVREEVRSGKEAFQNLQEQLEATITASAEMIHKYVVERLQAYREQIDDCERKLNGEHIEFWEQLTSESRRYLATGDYIRLKSIVGMECSGEAIEYAKALETELRKHLVELFASFTQQKGNPFIFGTEPNRVTMGTIFYKLEPLGLRTEFANSLGESGKFLLTNFHDLKKIKGLRDAAAHGGDIGRRQATELRDMVLEILPKIVALHAQ